MAIIYGPGVPEGQIRMLKGKFSYYLEAYGLSKARIRINPKLPICKNEDVQDVNMLVIGWGLPSEPTWEILLCRQNIGKFGQEFIGVDLFERHGFDGRSLKKPQINAGEYWSRKVQENCFRLFLKGYYLKSLVPYGIHRVTKKRSQKPYLRRSHCVLRPGDPEHIEIIRLIFDFFVNHDYSSAEISNLLIAESIQPPDKNGKWSSRVVKSILEEIVYIGANEYRGTIRYDIFPPVIDKSIFFEAQAKIMREPIRRKDIWRMNQEFDIP